MKVFGVVAAGKGPKRVGTLYVACQLLKTYFKLGTLNLCSSVIRSIETGRVFEFEEFPRRDKVTYMYYTGRLQVLNENFVAADTKLSYALQYCNPRRKRNIRMILKYLTPVKLSLGLIPNDELLQSYNLREYKMIVQALRKGDLRLFRHALEQHEDRFLKSGLYLLLEKLELHVYQRLVKKIYTIQKKQKQSDDPGRAHQLKIEVIAKELRGIDVDMDLDDVEGIMTMLIHKNLVKGYLAHKSKVVVLSKQDSFPCTPRQARCLIIVYILSYVRVCNPCELCVIFVRLGFVDVNTYVWGCVKICLPQKLPKNSKTFECLEKNQQHKDPVRYNLISFLPG